MCETWLQDIVVPVAYQNDCCYVHELSELTFSSLHKISMVGSYTQITKTIQLSKLEDWVFAGGECLPRAIQY